MKHRITLLAATALAVAAAQAAAAAPLEGFLGNFKACEVSEPLQEYAQSVGTRFATPCCEPGDVTVNEVVPIVLPEGVSGAVGEIAVTNHGEYIEAVLPLTGDYSGMPVQGLILNLGNENGIFSATLQFGVARADVLDRFGDAVQAANTAGEAAWDREGYGYSANIPQSEPGSITCDWSV